MLDLRNHGNREDDKNRENPGCKPQVPQTTGLEIPDHVHGMLLLPRNPPSCFTSFGFCYLSLFPSLLALYISHTHFPLTPNLFANPSHGLMQHQAGTHRGEKEREGEEGRKRRKGETRGAAAPTSWRTQILIDGPAIRNANRHDSRESTRAHRFAEKTIFYSV